MTPARLTIAAAMLIPLGDAIAKYAYEAHGVPALLMAWSRFAVGAALVAPIALAAKSKLSEMTPRLVLVRGLLITITITLILQAAARAPLADVFGGFFIAPAISFVLAILLLGERPSGRQSSLIAIGFIGVVLIVQPWAVISGGLIFAVLSGVFYGAFLTANRMMAGKHRGVPVLWTQLWVGAVLLAPFALSDVGAIDSLVVIGLVLASAATSAGANLMLLRAYELAEATRLAPLVYVQLIGATLYGALFFGALPGVFPAIGLGLLIFSGLAALLHRPAG